MTPERRAAETEEKGAVHALQSASAWLERWAEHVGSCRGGSQCSCGLTFVRCEAAQALEINERTQ